MAPAPEIGHQRLVVRLYKAIDGIVPGGEVLIAPVDVYLDENNVLQPDVLWIAPDSRCTPVEGKYFQGPPDLVVEILSPGSGHRDKSKKFKLYERFGVREYWIADPVHRLLEVWQLVEGRFVLQGAFGPGDTFPSAVLGGQTFDVSKVFTS
jgi:Uma2 family endonuclease